MAKILRNRSLEPPEKDGEMIKKLLMIVPILIAILIASGCNTTRGFGEDLESLGRYIQDSTD